MKSLHLVLIIFCIVIVSGTDKIAAQNNTAALRHFNQERISFYELQWENPAFMPFYPVDDYMDASIGMYQLKANETHLVQMGDQHSAFTFDAHSYKQINSQTFWGTAGYQKGNMKNQRWISNADYALTTPYSMGDLSGGDVKYENYHFKGGYANAWRNIYWGIGGDYATGNSYRQRDPRPLNRTSDLNLVGGVAYGVGHAYYLGVNGAYRSYKQTTDVTGYRESSDFYILFMKGFGLYDKFFSQVVNSMGVLYELKGTAFSAQLLPVRVNGWSISVKNLQNTMNQKEIGAFKTISQLTTRQKEAEVGYRWPTERGMSQVKIYARRMNKDGKEFNYGIGGKLINSVTKYKQELYDLGFSWGGQYSTKGRQYVYQLTSALYHDKSRHISPAASQTIDLLKIDARVGGHFRVKKSWLAVKQKIGFTKAVNTSLQTSVHAFENANDQMVIPNFEFRSASYFLTDTEIRYDFKRRENWNVYIQGAFQSFLFQKVAPTNVFKLAIGIAI